MIIIISCAMLKHVLDWCPMLFYDCDWCGVFLNYDLHIAWYQLANAVHVSYNAIEGFAISCCAKCTIICGCRPKVFAGHVPCQGAACCFSGCISSHHTFLAQRWFGAGAVQIWSHQLIQTAEAHRDSISGSHPQAAKSDQCGSGSQFLGYNVW